jgi:hypothetical protein
MICKTQDWNHNSYLNNPSFKLNLAPKMNSLKDILCINIYIYTKTIKILNKYNFVISKVFIENNWRAAIKQ